MTNITIEKLRAILSKERLIPYGKGNEDSQYVIRKYNENILICEAMYPTLHFFEILLRNRINATIKELFTEDWLLNIPRELRLSFKTKAKIRDIKDKFLKEKKRPAKHPDILSGLSFGFWCALFHGRYDPLLWHKKGSIRTAFPNLSREKQTRKYIESKISIIKEIRNRIAHHERIWDGSEDTYQVYIAYENCIELIHAMSSSSIHLLKMTDRFPQVYQKITGKNLS